MVLLEERWSASEKGHKIKVEAVANSVKYQKSKSKINHIDLQYIFYT